MSLDKDKVKNIAFLSRLHVSDEQADNIAEDLSKIIGWVEQLAEVDTDGVEPMYSVAEITLPQRKDEVTDGGYAEAVVKNAPESEDNYFLVPKVVE